MTGYQIAKFISKEAQDGDGASYQDVAIIRYAESCSTMRKPKRNWTY